MQQARAARRLVVVGVTVGCAVLLAGSSPAAPATGTAVPLPRVTLISDSAAASLAFDTGAKAILAQGVDLYLEPGQGRTLGGEPVQAPYAPPSYTPPTAIQLIGERGRSLGVTVIMAVGYNDYSDRYAAYLEEALAALKRAGVQHVLWTTLHVSEAHHGYVTINAAIQDAATRHPELTVLDWDACVSSHPEWLGDEVHPIGVGMRQMASLMHTSLVELGIARVARAGES